MRGKGERGIEKVGRSRYREVSVEIAKPLLVGIVQPMEETQ